MTTQLTIKERITRAKIQINKKYPFYAFIVLRMQDQEVPEEMRKIIPSMAVNPKGELFYNPDWIGTLSDEELQGVIAHESLHLVLSHLIRVGNRDMEVWNIATDLQCNNLLVMDNITLPKEGLIPSGDCWSEPKMNLKIEDISKKNSERIYEELYDQMPKRQSMKIKISSDGKGNVKIQLPKGFDKHIHGKKNADKKKGKDKGQGGSKNGKGNPLQDLELTPKEMRELEKQWTDVLVEAATYAKMRGNLPRGMERLVGDLLEPEFNWQSLLYKHITNRIPYDFSWARSGRKSISTGIYLPDTKKELLEVVVGVDVSGSVSQKEFTKFITEVVSIAKSFSQVKMNFIPWGTSVKCDLEVANGNISKIFDYKIKGFDGTDINCVLQYINDHRPSTKLFVCLTDGYFGKIIQPMNYDTIWVLTKSGSDSDIENTGQVVQMRKE